MPKTTLRNSLLTLASLVAFQTPVLAEDGAAQKSPELHRIIDTYWAYSLEQAPVFASSLGVDDYASQVSDVSLEAADKRVEKAKGWLKELDAIDQDALSENDKTNFGVLYRSLTEAVEANSYGQRTINFTNRSGWHQSFASMQNNLPFRTEADYKSYIARLKQYPQINRQSIAVADQAIAGGYGPALRLDGWL